MYGLIKYFGKEVVNPLLLGYMGLGASTGIKGLLLQVPALGALDEPKLAKLKVEKIGLDLEVSRLDLVSLVLSYIGVGVYLYTKNWLFNNLLAILFCVHGIQFMFLGNFTTGFILLSLLFFYDIFFVFGTDVMLTVAKSIDAPIKLLFPKNWNTVPPEFSLLGLGDIVIPGLFISLCLRYDVIKSMNLEEIGKLIQRDRGDDAVDIFAKQAKSSPKTYFYGSLIGYLIAIIVTVIVMLVFDRGQPALLYLVPGCLMSVIINAFRLGEIKELWAFSEEKILGGKEEKKD